MTLLDFARGPALDWSIYILVGGTVLRLLGMLLIRNEADLSTPRKTGTAGAGARTVFTRMWPKPEFMSRTLLPVLLGHALHFGIAITVFLFVPHILFIKSVTGLAWTGLPNDLVLIAGAIAIGAGAALWVRRLTTPVLQTISTLDDHLSLLVTLLPLVTGMLAYAHIGLDYETMLGLHVLSVELLFIYFPLGKLFHAVAWIPTRFQLSAAFQRRGVKA